MILGRILAATLLGSGLLVAGAAQAEPNNCPPGHEMKGWCDNPPQSRHHRARDNRRDDDWRYRRDDDWRDRRNDDWRRDRSEDARERAYEEGYRDGRHDAWRTGDRLPRDRYRLVPDFYQYGWPVPSNGLGYAEADGRHYLINMATGLILDVLSR